MVPQPDTDKRRQFKERLDGLKIGSDTPLTLALQNLVQTATGERVKMKKMGLSLNESLPHLDPRRTYKKATDDAPTILMVSDVMDSCGYNPCEFVKDLAEKGTNVKIRFIGIGQKGQVNAQRMMACMQQFPNFLGAFADSQNTMARLINRLQDSDEEAGLRAEALKLKTPAPEAPPSESTSGSYRVKTEASGHILPRGHGSDSPDEGLKAGPAGSLDP